MSYGVRKDFYNSKLWKTCKNEVWLRQNLMCGICGKPVYVNGISDWIPKENRRTGIVHHIEHLTDHNVYDDNISINIDNLIGVCKECHEKQHHTDIAKRSNVDFDDDGNLISRKE